MEEIASAKAVIRAIHAEHVRIREFSHGGIIRK